MMGSPDSSEMDGVHVTAIDNAALRVGVAGGLGDAVADRVAVADGLADGVVREDGLADRVRLGVGAGFVVEDAVVVDAVVVGAGVAVGGALVGDAEVVAGVGADGVGLGLVGVAPEQPDSSSAAPAARARGVVRGWFMARS